MNLNQGSFNLIYYNYQMPKKSKKSKQSLIQQSNISETPQCKEHQNKVKVQKQRRIVKGSRRSRLHSFRRIHNNKKALKKKQQSFEGQGQVMSLAKATRLNSCLKRRNPHTIYAKDKKDKFYTQLNSQYTQKMSVIRDSQNTQDKKKEKAKKKCTAASDGQILFKQNIQIRQYYQEEAVAQFMSIQPIQQKVNQQQNKLDC